MSALNLLILSQKSKITTLPSALALPTLRTIKITHLWKQKIKKMSTTLTFSSQNIAKIVQKKVSKMHASR